MSEKDSEKQFTSGEPPQDHDDGFTSAKTTGPPSTDSTVATDLEEQRETVRQNNPNGFSRINTGVSVEQAEADFAELRRELTGLSRASRTRSRKESDAEKGGFTNLETPGSEESIEAFDLETTLRGGLDAEREAGIKPKHIGVYWDGLTVKGMGGTANFVKTFPDAFKDFVDYWTPLMSLLGKGSKGTEVTLLENFKGVVNPGEMVLVLGRPGSGCTTFLKSIANQRWGYTSVTGEVLYGPFTAEEFQQYRGEAVYNQEDDIHHATLTVEQTLAFALDTKVSKRLPAGTSKSKFKEEVITMLLKMFNIEHTRKTVVGDALVRGVSGGERKRVSIAEMMITNACVLSWDNSTRGLDASTALDFVKSLRIQTNLYKTSTFVSLYQASENIYKQFDKVLLIDGGKQVYFGPTTEARAYFEGLGFLPRPRQTTPDYITGCTDEFEREYSDGFSARNAPHSPETLAEAFEKSRFARQLSTEMAEYKARLEHEQEMARHDDFRMAVRESKRSGAKHSVYSVGFHLQVWALMKRQFAIKFQDKLSMVLSWIRTIVIALVLGSLYFNLGQTSASAFSKGGLLFIALLFNAFEAFSELGSTMMGRPIVNKHKAYTFHRPSALWIAQIFVDTAFSAARILVFSIILYFMTNLTRTPGAFFTFYLLILVGNISMTLYFRIIACLSPDFDYAIKFAVVTITLFVLTSGYLIQYQSQQVWLRWIFWINTLGLTFSSLMANEFGRNQLRCSDESLIPSGPSYGNISHQVCTLAGSTPGSLDINGGDYITQGFSYAPEDLWRNFGIIMAIIVFFLVMNVVLGEFVKYGMGGNQAKVFAKPNAERKALNDALNEKRLQRQKSREADTGSALKIESSSILTWEDLKYDVPVPGGTRRLLNSIYGYCKPGQLTALMGASGAGKTTLLDVLAARKNIGVITGDILVDGLKPGKEFQRSTSYAEQLDMHDPTQTVREALRFSADLRQPFETPREEKYTYVEEIIALLEMENIADCIIGTPEAGLTVEQRKRVTIGVELAAKPQLLLFLDEPTSGLDSQSAFNIVRFLRKLAAAGQAILCTIHQPNAALFENFDRLLLLQRGGRCVYFGDIGKDACILRDYLARHGAVAGPSDNVAEFMLEAIGAGSAPRVGNRDWSEIWNDSPELANVKDTISQFKESRKEAAAQTDLSLQREYASPLAHQLSVVIKRTNLSFWRSPNYLFTRIFNHIVISVLTGLTYLNLDDSRSALQYKVFVMFQITVLTGLLLPQVELMYVIKRSIFFREQLSKMYSTFTFTSAMVLAELPYSIICSVIFFVPLYYIPGFQTESSRAGYQYFMVLITELFSITLAQCIAALSPSPFVASQFDPFIVITFSMFCGVSIPAPQMPAFWRSWLYQLDPFTRLIGGTVTTALDDLQVNCRPWELNSFTAPEGQTCGEYMAPFLEKGAGYIVDNATSLCQYCAYKVGNEFYEPLGFKFDYRWRDLGIFLAFVGSNLIILFCAGRFLNFNRR
ncbi:ABC-2 type transporter-domain-containing protein [Daldinia loculata]|uniref:ABC-2 type transporter-domain-containing protein n=1 Tax=Daldinia loculata TaxID=103429 RepID=UPI0020C31E76|nr:ABC-2 type transporter-domain-containing protein [Daldinia loculata]KAI1651187.1 ABC-2 type transporter-domain-containing protein [Daldinia loculata]